MRYVTVARLSDCQPNQAVAAQAEGNPLVLVRTRSALFALSGLCPHRNLPLAGGDVWGEALDCPWHHFQFDLRTGRNLYPGCVYPLASKPELAEQIRPLTTYPVRVVEGAIQVGLDGGA